jgi:hypothetical protein
MLIPQAGLYDVPAAESTLFTLREDNSYARVLFFENLMDDTLSFRIEKSLDGGAHWTTIGTTFDVGAVGSGTEVVSKYIVDAGILRVRGSGGNTDRDALVTLARYYKRGGTVYFPAEQ